MRNAVGLCPLLLGGLRIDTHQITVLAALPAVLSPFLGHFSIAATIAGDWYLVAFIQLAFLEVVSPPPHPGIRHPLQPAARGIPEASA